MKLLVIGLDGMSFDVINPLIGMGHLANVARLIREGAQSTLLSTIPSITPVAWSSFITGKSPGDHGVYGWGIKTADYRLSIINANYLQEESVWTILHRAGKQIGVIGLPMSYPPSPYPSFMIGGPLSPGVHSPFAFPETLYPEISKNVGEYIIDFDRKQQLTMDDESFVSAISQMVRSRGDTTLYLMQKYPWDLLMPVFVATDRLQHRLWHHLDFAGPPSPIQQRIVDFYNMVDRYIGRFVEATPDPKTVVLVSDHGFGAGRSRVSLNGWLMREGYLCPSQPDPFGVARQRAMLLANQLGLTRQRLKKGLSRLGLLNRLENQLDCMSVYETAYDWQRSTAFASGHGIYLNVQGREREGIVAPGSDYRLVRSEIVQKLSQLRDPLSGEAVFEEVHYREALYRGRRVEMAPDIVPIPRDGYNAVTQFSDSSSIHEGVFGDLGDWDRGTHRREGILIAWGQKVEPGAHLHEPLFIWDMAPTLLCLAGVPIPSDMTGRAITELVRPEYRDCSQSLYEQTIDVDRPEGGPLWADKEDERRVQDRLRGLGYLE